MVFCTAALERFPKCPPCSKTVIISPWLLKITSRSMSLNVNPMMNLDSMALKGNEVCGLSVLLLKTATFKNVFSMLSVRSACGQLRGAR